ncbi:MAG TPA: hypothetical protein VH420_00035, partial [Gaiellaceae bacterium]
MRGRLLAAATLAAALCVLMGGMTVSTGATPAPDGAPPPTIGPERAVSDEPTDEQVGPGIAFDGTNYLATWQEGTSNVRGGRVDRFGAHLDGPGIPVGVGSDQTVAFDGTNYLVGWSTLGGPPSIQGARVNQSGTVLDPTPISIYTGGPTQWAQEPSAVFDGTNYLVGYHELIDVSQHEWIKGRRVATDGSVLDDAAVDFLGFYERPKVAAGNSRSLFVWKDGDDDGIHAGLVDDGGQLHGSPFLIAADGDAPNVAFDGTNFLVTWSDDDILGKRVDENGTVLDASPIQISTAAGNQRDVSAAFDGTDYIVAWEDNRDG